MKKIFAAIVFLLIVLPVFSQNLDSQSYDELMKRSRKARTTGIILVSTGPVVAVGGIGTLIYGVIQNDLDRGDYTIDQNGNYVQLPAKKYTTEIVVGAAATLVGLGMALGSIAFTSKANDLRREAKRVKLKTSTGHINIPGFQNGLAGSRTRQYKLSLLIPLGR